MANSFSLLLSYIDNLLWLCTQLFYGSMYIIEFNFKLVTAFFKGCVQLWNLSVQAVINLGNAFVFSIQFLEELPARCFHLGKYLLELGMNQINNASQAFMTWCWMILTNLGTAVFSICTRFFDSLVFHHKQIVDIISSFMYSAYGHVKEGVNTNVIAMHRFGSDVQDSVLGFCNVMYEYFIAGVSYPIAVFDKCIKNVNEGLHFCVSFLKTVGDSFMRVLEDFTEIVDASTSSISNGLFDIVHILEEIATFPVRVIYNVYQMVAAVFDSTVEGCSVLSLFIAKNWGALLALALCVTLVWITITLAGQHERNVQHILQDLTRLVNSFTHSRPREMDREPERPEGHLNNDIHHQGQQQGDLQGQDGGDEQNVDDGADEHLPVGAVGGDGDQPGPSRIRHTPHSSYSLRPRPFTPPPSGENSSVESIMSDLKNRLTEEQERKTCVVCLDAIKNTLFMPCRHLCVCLPCADKIISSEDILARQCPLCRARIRSIVEVYS